MEFKNVYVAVCDILGFKDLIYNNNSDVTNKILAQFIATLELSASGGKAIQYDFDDSSNIVADSTEIKINFNLFSDTVVLWTLDDTTKSFFELLNVTKNLFHLSLINGLPIRGAISQGDLFVKQFQIESNYNNYENIIYGKALVKAYELEQEQLWSGCIFDPEFANSGNRDLKLIFEHKTNCDRYFFYDVPLKSTGCKKHLTLNWVDWSENNELTEGKIIESFSALNKTINESVKIKLDNTISYFKYSKKLYEKHFKSNISNT
ncbi:MAG: hypothetical protein NTW25_00280 [Candidatus Kapabacteria bacterium]|nr:hypothetical protein [Candidatus Kapabacteria bacterium]